MMCSSFIGKYLFSLKMSLLGGSGKSNKDVSNPYQFKYVCYGQDLSFFTQKLMAVLKW